MNARAVVAAVSVAALLLTACAGGSGPEALARGGRSSPSAVMPSSPSAEVDAPEPPNARPPRLKVSGDVETYRVRGATPFAVDAALHKRGPGKWAAHVTYSISYSWHVFDDGDGCRIISPAVAASHTTLLPEAASGMPAPAAAYADRAITRLRVHENGHVRIVEATARDTLKGLARLRGRSFPSCAKAEAEATRTAKRLTGIGRQQQRAYDARTRHGINQAAA